MNFFVAAWQKLCCWPTTHVTYLSSFVAYLPLIMTNIQNPFFWESLAWYFLSRVTPIKQFTCFQRWTSLYLISTFVAEMHLSCCKIVTGLLLNWNLCHVKSFKWLACSKHELMMVFKDCNSIDLIQLLMFGKFFSKNELFFIFLFMLFSYWFDMIWFVAELQLTWCLCYKDLYMHAWSMIKWW